MADVTYGDTPNDPAHPLTDGPLEPVSFTSAKALEFLTVQQGDLFETAFMDGAFTPPYAADSTISEDLKSATVLRAGGWLEPPYFKPRVRPATGTQAMAPIYDVDFRTLPNQTIGAAGAYTIDGKTWWAKGTKNANHTDTSLINGTGLRFTLAGSLGYQPSIDLPNGVFNTQLLFLPLSELSDFNADAPIAMMFRFAVTSGWPQSVTSIALGFIGAASDGAPFLAASRPSQIWFGCAAAASAAAFAGGAGYGTIATTPTMSTLSDHLFGVVKPLKRAALTFHQQWSGDFPDVEDTFSSGITGLVADADPVNPGIAILLNSQNTWSAQLTQLRVLQPKAA